MRLLATYGTLIRLLMRLRARILRRGSIFGPTRVIQLHLRSPDAHPMRNGSLSQASPGTGRLQDAARAINSRLEQRLSGLAQLPTSLSNLLLSTPIRCCWVRSLTLAHSGQKSAYCAPQLSQLLGRLRAALCAQQCLPQKGQRPSVSSLLPDPSHLHTQLWA